MLRLIGAICICLVTFPAFCQSKSKYEVGTILEVKAHQAPDDDSSDVVAYDISVKVGDTVYLVLFKSTVLTSTVKYAAGRNLLISVGEKTITYNDILGRSQEVPIISRKPATEAK